MTNEGIMLQLRAHHALLLSRFCPRGLCMDVYNLFNKRIKATKLVTFPKIYQEAI